MLLEPLSWPSHSLLARETGYTREYVIRVMHDLVAEGIVKEVFDAKGRRRYQLPVYDFKAKRCGCEHPPVECELSSQAPQGNCELSLAGVNSTARKSRHPNENAHEPLQEEPEQTRAHTREAEDEVWRRRYDAQYGEPTPFMEKELAMPKRRRPHPELWPDHACPLDPEPFRVAALEALAASTTPHPLLHERVSPHIILQDGPDETAIRLTDNPMARAMLTLRDHYDDQQAYQSACWRLMAIGPLLEQPELMPWVRSQTAAGCEVEDAVFWVAATAPLNAKGEFFLKPFCTALEQWATEHPDPPEVTP